MICYCYISILQSIIHANAIHKLVWKVCNCLLLRVRYVPHKQRLGVNAHRGGEYMQTARQSCCACCPPYLIVCLPLLAPGLKIVANKQQSENHTDIKQLKNFIQLIIFFKFHILTKVKWCRYSYNFFPGATREQ